MSNVREYHIDYSDEVGAAKTTLQLHIDTLVSFRHTTSHPEELEWEIRLYEYMLEDPVVRLKAYQDARYGATEAEPRWSKPPLSKRETVAVLGWVVL